MDITNTTDIIHTTDAPAAGRRGSGASGGGPRGARSRLRPFRTPVRGHAFSAPPTQCPQLVAGLPATLAREPGNPADPLAIAVWVADPARPWRMGYLDRAVAARLAPRLDDGVRVGARLDGWVGEPGGRWQRPMLLLLPADTADVGGRAGAQDDVLPASWGRPPGVRRRRVFDSRGRC